MALIFAYKDRGKTIELTINNADDTVYTPTAGDILRVVIGREGKLGTNFADAQFHVTSEASTSNGSRITKNQDAQGNVENGTNTLRLDAQDLNFLAGVYTLFFSLVDNSDAQDEKVVDRQVFSLEDT